MRTIFLSERQTNLSVVLFGDGATLFLPPLPLLVGCRNLKRLPLSRASWLVDAAAVETSSEKNPFNPPKIQMYLRASQGE